MPGAGVSSCKDIGNLKFVFSGIHILLYGFTDIHLLLGVSGNSINRAGDLNIQFLARLGSLVNRMAVVSLGDEVGNQVLQLIRIHRVGQAGWHHRYLGAFLGGNFRFFHFFKFQRLESRLNQRILSFLITNDSAHDHRTILHFQFMLFELFGYHQIGLEGGFQYGFVVAAFGQVRQVGANPASLGAKAVASHAENRPRTSFYH